VWSTFCVCVRVPARQGHGRASSLFVCRGGGRRRRRRRAAAVPLRAGSYKNASLAFLCCCNKNKLRSARLRPCFLPLNSPTGHRRSISVWDDTNRPPHPIHKKSGFSLPQAFFRGQTCVGAPIPIYCGLKLRRWRRKGATREHTHTLAACQSHRSHLSTATLLCVSHQLFAPAGPELVDCLTPTIGCALVISVIAVGCCVRLQEKTPARGLHTCLAFVFGRPCGLIALA
jgi:hypothetical protein